MAALWATRPCNGHWSAMQVQALTSRNMSCFLLGTRRIAVLMDAPQNDRSRPRLAAFVQGLLHLDWSDGRNGAD